MPQELRALFALELMAGASRQVRKAAELRGPVEARDRESLGRKALEALSESLQGLGVERVWASGLVIPDDHPATVLGWSDRTGTMAVCFVPQIWISRVWSRGIAVIGGKFVLDAEPRLANPAEINIRYLEWETSGERLVPVVRRGIIDRSGFLRP